MNMVRAAFVQLNFFGTQMFKLANSLSMKHELRHALYFLLAVCASQVFHQIQVIPKSVIILYDLFSSI
jgi:hypothetical protein